MVEPGDAHLVEGQGREVVVGDPAGEALRGLAQEIRCCAAEHQVAAIRMAVDHDAQDGEQVGTALDLVEDDQPGQRFESQLGFGEPGEVTGEFQVEPVDRATPRRRNVMGERRLAHLAGPDDGHTGDGPQQVRALVEMATANEHRARISILP